MGMTLDDLVKLPCYPLDRRYEMPSTPGVYAAVSGIIVLYVGRSKNINQRWYSHNKLNAIAEFSGVRIYWKDCDRFSLGAIEKQWITALKPLLNIYVAGTSKSVIKNWRHYIDTPLPVKETVEERAVRDMARKDSRIFAREASRAFDAAAEARRRELSWGAKKLAWEKKAVDWEARAEEAKRLAGNHLEQEVPVTVVQPPMTIRDFIRASGMAALLQTDYHVFVTVLDKDGLELRKGVSVHGSVDAAEEWIDTHSPAKFGGSGFIIVPLSNAEVYDPGRENPASAHITVPDTGTTSNEG